jgi:AraC family transcriptional regulator
MSNRPIALAVPGRFELFCHHSPPMIYPEEAHSAVQVCIPLEQARYSVTRQSETGRRLVHHLDESDVLAVPKEQPHGVAWQRSADIVSLLLDEQFIAEALGIGQFRIPDAFTVRDRFISDAAAQLRTSLRSSSGCLSMLFTEAVTITIAYRIGLSAPTARGIRDGTRLSALPVSTRARLEQFIDAHLDQQISLRGLAAQAGMSMWHFLRRFRVTYGLSPHELIRQRRLARARALLSDTNLSIAEVALEVGMTHSHFSRTFLNRCGASPTAFRRECQR